jgi:hypothetical protein
MRSRPLGYNQSAARHRPSKLAQPEIGPRYYFRGIRRRGDDQGAA